MYMTPIDTARTALLLMDFQPDILDSRPGGAEVLSAARSALDLARKADLQVVFVRVAFTPQDYASASDRNKTFAGLRDSARLPDGAPGSAVHPDLAPAARDVVVTKTRVGAFSTTNLHTHLSARGIDTLVLAGVSTSGVVLSTVRDAADHDDRLLVLEVCCPDAPEIHTLLVNKVFPRQADIITVPRLADLIA
jgi:nicotinamidase-related amidase